MDAPRDTSREQNAATRIFLSAGEASGEQYAVQLMAALRAARPDAAFFGLGGQRMEAEGFRRIVRAEDVAVMGITEIVRHIPRIYREYRRLRRSLETERPAVVVLIDFPDVNLGLARRAKALGIPVIFFVSPQVWAWKQHRLRQIRRDVDQMLVIFPFEEPWYRERGVAATFVGHPLAELPLPTISRERFAREHGLDPLKEWIGLLPGSRMREITLNLPTMLAAARALQRAYGNHFEFVLPLAPTLHAQQVAAVQRLLGDRRDVLTVTDARAALFHARASVVASGTATVEAALIGNPFVVVYRLSRLSYAVAKRVVKVPHVAMSNLIAGRRVVPELIQDAFTPGAVVAALRPLIEPTPEREGMQLALGELRLSLQQTASAIELVASHVLAVLPAVPQETSPLTSKKLSVAL
ncbi:lipid-A-disaccharide synthase [Acidipila sp. EB88]|uniref:lipid-A-disaccharide synthase n=1 Tax=Acidipila sp. EB88 TaxID=2305226 RepID=UPI000F5F6B52|nr:lipid-A-disaccharide synthase [Acidipila sp. EB88]RRA49888.1 lipid-A-disaccharide synthase [Acidipila sp. EB88]